MEIPLRRLADHAVLPTYAHPGDAGADLYAAESATLRAGGGRAVVGTGVAIALPDGHAAFVQPRSGLAAKHGVTVLNSPGLVDAGYRGELRVILVNTDPDTDYEVVVGDRIAQLVIRPVAEAAFREVEALPDAARNDGGFGSTGR